MKIAYISFSAIPSRQANSIGVMKMCQAFAQAGHSVTLVVPDVSDIEPGVSDMYSFYGVKPVFKIHKIKLRSSWEFIQKFFYAFDSARYAQKENSELVYGRFIPGCTSAAAAGLPVIGELHIPYGPGIIKEWLFRRFIGTKSFRHIVVISESLKRDILNVYPQLEDKIIVVRDGAEAITEDYKPSRRTNRLQIGFVGHLYKGRGIELILELAARCPNADFHLAGGTEEDINYWKAAAIDYKNVKFYGFMPHPETEKFRLKMDILLAPYQKKVSVADNGNMTTEKWMSPLKLFEYMAAGKAIISSDIPVLREILEHEKTAIFCPPDDADAWQIAIERMRDDIVLRDRLGRAAREIFLKHYTWKARAEKVLAGVL
ncbi:MAG: glycosyltransferase family 4 protein [Sedimentisphaerales bacterium]